MPFTHDVFDEIQQADVADVAPGMIDAIRESLGQQFDVGDVTVRTLLVAQDGFATVRWSAECTDSILEDRRRTDRSITIHGLSLVGGDSADRVAAHYIDWAGAMAQLGITTSRPSAVDRPLTSS